MAEGVRGGAGSGFRFQVSGVWFHVSGVLLLSPPDSEGQSWWGCFLVSSVRLLSPPETGGVPAGGGGMI